MDIFLCTLEHNHCVEYIDIWPRYETEIEVEFIIAPTRGRARRLMAETIDVEFVHPMSIRKLSHHLDELKEGVLFGSWWVDEYYHLFSWDELEYFDFSEMLELE